MLRADVLDGTDAFLAALDLSAEPRQLAEQYRSQLLTVVAHVRRLTEADESERARGSAEAEVLELQRDLAAAKLALAEAAGRRDELLHELRQPPRKQHSHGGWGFRS